MAGFRRGAGAVLWVAASPGPHGYERFPYLPQALADLGLTAPFRSAHLWAFFDSSYRSRVDLDYFAPRWRQAGIAALHVAAWHYWEPDPQADEYLRHLIDACHRNGDPGLRLARAAARQRKILGPASGVARENRAASGRAARLAQADEPDQSRGVRRSCSRAPQISRHASIGTA